MCRARGDLQKLDVLDAHIATEFSDFVELSNPEPLEAQKSAALLTPDEALLLYLTTDKGTWLWVLRRDRIVLQPIPFDAKALFDQVSMLRRTLDRESNPISRHFRRRKRRGHPVQRAHRRARRFPRGPCRHTV